jgi:hypothetical protein
MAAEYTAIAKIVYQGVNSPSPKGENVLLTHVSNFAEAVTKIEKYYGTDIVDFKNMPVTQTKPNYEMLPSIGKDDFGILP